jgi:hypothetical protein
MSINYVSILDSRYPGAQWSLNGDTYDGLTWLENTQKPSQAELDAAWPAVQREQQTKIVESQRKAAYTIESDPVFFQWQRGDATEQEWLDAVEAVKAKYPYPA